MAIDWSTIRRDWCVPHHRFILTSHVRPDCDALGSELGMAQVLAALGKEVRIVNAHPTPAEFELHRRGQADPVSWDATSRRPN